MRQTIKKVFFLCIALSIFSCKSEPVEEELPLETQTGNNTFGCKVDGTPFVSHTNVAPAGKQALSATYYKEADLLTIEAYSKKHSNSFQKIFLALCHPTVNSNLPFANLAIYYPTDIDNIQYRAVTNLDWVQYVESNVINLSKIDTINHIVSGNYYFTGICSDGYMPIDAVNKQITEGRFDIKQKILYEPEQEVPIINSLPILRNGINLRRHEFVIVRSQADLEKIVTPDCINNNIMLKNIDFSQDNLLLGSLSTSSATIQRVEPNFIQVASSLFLYRINVSVGILTSFDGCYHGIVVPKLPENSTIVVDVIQKYN